MSTLRRSFGSVLSTTSNIEIKWPKSEKTINYTFVVSSLTLQRDWAWKFTYGVPRSSANREIAQVVAQAKLLRKWLHNFVNCVGICASFARAPLAQFRDLRKKPINKFLAQKKGYNDLSPIQSTKLDRVKPATTPSLAFPRKVSTKRLL